MLYQPGPLIGGASGSINGVTFVLSKNGPVLRRRGQKRKTLSAKQLQRVALVQNAQNDWRALTEADKEAWRTLASNFQLPNRLGVRRNISGYQWWLFFALISPTAGVPVSNVPPALGLTGPTTDLAATYSLTTGFQITFTKPLTFPGLVMFAFATRPFSTSLRKSYNSYKLMGVESVRIPAPFWEVPFEAIYGTPQIGEIIPFKVRTWLPQKFPSMLVTGTTTVTA